MPWEHLGIPPQTWRSPVLLGAVSFGVPHSRCTAVARDLHVSVDITAPLDFALHLPNGSGPPLPRAVRHSLSTAADALYSTVGGFRHHRAPRNEIDDVSIAGLGVSRVSRSKLRSGESS
jgi:hypothetical protein